MVAISYYINLLLPIQQQEPEVKDDQRQNLTLFDSKKKGDTTRLGSISFILQDEVLIT